MISVDTVGQSVFFYDVFKLNWTRNKRQFESLGVSPGNQLLVCDVQLTRSALTQCKICAAISIRWCQRPSNTNLLLQFWLFSLMSGRQQCFEHAKGNITPKTAVRFCSITEGNLPSLFSLDYVWSPMWFTQNLPPKWMLGSGAVKDGYCLHQKQISFHFMHYRPKDLPKHVCMLLEMHSNLLCILHIEKLKCSIHKYSRQVNMYKMKAHTHTHFTK